MLCDTVLAFDHVKHRILIVANARITPDEDLESLYQFACAKIQFLERELERSLSQPARETRPAPEFSANQTREEYEGGVRTIKEHIAAGDIYQAVLSQRFETRVTADPFTIYRALRHVNPSPYMYFMRMNGLAIVGSSPEMLVRVEGRRAETHPIAGTRPRGTNEDEDLRMAEELKRNEKERAEHVMLVDLGRNDLGRVCEFGSVRVPQYMALERYSHVMHLVSTVDGKLAEDRDHLDALVACFPAGTVSGAPKIKAMQILAGLEPTRRDIYAGAVGYIDFAGNLDFCITIRTITIRNGVARVQAGAGHRRRLESGRGISGNQGQGAGADAGARHGGSGPVILLLDNYDSFTFNLAQYLGELGAPPLVRRNDEITLDEVRELQPDRIVISPGPGRPEDAGISVALIRELGPEHAGARASASATRASALAFGGSVVRAPVPMHGKVSSVEHDGAGIFKGVATPLAAGRYHSLVIADPLPDDLEVCGPRRGRHDHGGAPSHPAGARRAVPSRVGADRRGPSAAAKFPGACDVQRAHRETAAARGPHRGGGLRGDGRDHGRPRRAGADCRIPDRAGDEGGASGRDRRPGADHARAARPGCQDVRAGVRHLRHRRRPIAHLQRLHRRGAGRRGLRRARRQAWQSLGLEHVRQRRPVRGTRRADRRAAGNRRALPRRRRASRSFWRRRSTRRCATPRRRARSWACAPRSTCSVR